MSEVTNESQVFLTEAESREAYEKLKGDYPLGPGVTQNTISAEREAELREAEEAAKTPEQRKQEAFDSALDGVILGETDLGTPEGKAQLRETIAIGDSVVQEMAAEQATRETEQAVENALASFRQTFDGDDEGNLGDAYLWTGTDEFGEDEFALNTAAAHAAVQALIDTPGVSIEQLQDLAMEYEDIVPVMEIATQIAAARAQQPLLDAEKDLDDLNEATSAHAEKIANLNGLDVDDLNAAAAMMLDSALGSGLEVDDLTTENMQRFVETGALYLLNWQDAVVQAERANRRNAAMADELRLTKDSRDASGQVVTRSVEVTLPDGSKITESVPYRDTVGPEAFFRMDEALKDYFDGVRAPVNRTRMFEDPETGAKVPIIETVGGVTRADLKADKIAAGIPRAMAEEKARQDEFARVQRMAFDAEQDQKRKRLEDELGR